MDKPTYLTAQGLEQLKAELAELKGPKREELSNRLRVAIQQGDLSENAEYIVTKEEQGFVEGRIRELEHIIRNAVIIQENEGKHEKVELGARVTIQENGHPPETYHIVGVSEANPRQGRISNESPIGRALMGKREGDTVVAKVPRGTIELKILEIS